MMEIFERRLSKFISPLSIPSIKIAPSMYDNRNSAFIMEDFPAPVLKMKRDEIQSDAATFSISFLDFSFECNFERFK